MSLVNTVTFHVPLGSQGFRLIKQVCSPRCFFWEGAAGQQAVWFPAEESNGLCGPARANRRAAMRLNSGAIIAFACQSAVTSRTAKTFHGRYQSMPAEQNSCSESSGFRFPFETLPIRLCSER
jgi:hypothetical protein